MGATHLSTETEVPDSTLLTAALSSHNGEVVPTRHELLCVTCAGDIFLG